MSSWAVVDLDADAVERPAAAPGELEHPASTHMPMRAATTVAPPSRRPCRIGADLPGKTGPGRHLTTAR